MTTLTLHNARGMRVAIDGRDASLQSWWAPDRYGRMADVLAAASPLVPSPAHWQAGTQDERSLLLHRAQDGLHARLHYRLGDDGSLQLDCEITADAAASFQLPAPLFNLQGRPAGVGDHVLRLAADRYRPALGPQRGPQAGPDDVAGGALDFRQPAPIGARLAWPELAGTDGFEHDFFLPDGCRLREAALLADPASGRVLRFSSTQGGFHLRSDMRIFPARCRPWNCCPASPCGWLWPTVWACRIWIFLTYPNRYQ